MMAKKYLLTLVALAAVPALTAQTTTPPSENGAVNIWTSGGVSLGVPAVQAVAIAGNATAVSPKKTTLATAGFGASVRAWKWIAPYVDLNAVDTGTAKASVGTTSATGTSDTFIFAGGARFVGQTGKVRPFAQFGGGLLHQNISLTASGPGQSASGKVSASAGLYNYGAGVQLFGTPRFGGVVAFDGYRLGAKPLSGGQNYGAIRIGFFFQTKSSIR